MADLEMIKNKFEEMLLDDDEGVVEYAGSVIDDGMDVFDFLQKVYQPVLSSLGDKFSRLEIFLPELVSASEIAETVSEKVLKPRLLESGQETEIIGRVVMGTAFGDMHDIGKNMVIFMLQVNGFEVTDLGVDVSPQTFLDTAKEKKADIVAISALMSTSLPYMKEVIDLRDGFGLKDDFKVIVGGAAVNPDYAKNIGADLYSKDAMGAVDVCKEIVKNKKESVK